MDFLKSIIYALVAIKKYQYFFGTLFHKIFRYLTSRNLEPFPNICVPEFPKYSNGLHELTALSMVGKIGSQGLGKILELQRKHLELYLTSVLVSGNQKRFLDIFSRK